MTFYIENKKIGKHEPVYFIADIASNHGGDLSLAKELIYACSESGVDAVKMQNFSADTIVSDYGFKNLESVVTHQSSWKTSVYESYKAASIPFEWTLELKALTEKLGMAYFTSPYSIELVRKVEPYVSAFKLGSGDITWHKEIEEMASYNKPLLIATGASSLEEVIGAVGVALKKTNKILLMQCNTNYTAKRGEPEALTRERFNNVNLKVLETYAKLWPGIPLGLSDHTHGNLTVIAAVSLYSCAAVEKHFTLDSSQEGQDHSFSMMPNEWKRMVELTACVKQELNDNMEFDDRLSLVKKYCDNPEYVNIIIGDGVKSIQDNERNTVVVQRRAIRASRNLRAGEIVTAGDLVVLRPCPIGALAPFKIDDVIGRVLRTDVHKGDYLKAEDLK